jgi:protein-arginine kinase
MFDEKLGNVTCCPSNLGGGLRASVHLRIPLLIKKLGLEEIDRIAHTMHC